MVAFVLPCQNRWSVHGLEACGPQSMRASLLQTGDHHGVRTLLFATRIMHKYPAFARLGTCLRANDVHGRVRVVFLRDVSEAGPVICLPFVEDERSLRHSPKLGLRECGKRRRASKCHQSRAKWLRTQQQCGFIRRVCVCIVFLISIALFFFISWSCT